MNKKVEVLMSTYNGERFLKEQIDSILNQEGVEISLMIRDDGSTDKTINIIDEIVKQNSNVSMYRGENLGPARSFMDLIYNSNEADYYAFADQDDVWDSKKIISAINKMDGKENEPTLYISALQVVDENLNDIEFRKVEGNFCLEGEMVKNFATGCTQVFNNKLRNILKKYKPNFIVMHDSWITRVCYAVEGKVIIDENSYIKYRQHEKNLIGYKDAKLKKIKKQYKMAFKRNIRMRAEIAKELKSGYPEEISIEANQLANNLINYNFDVRAKKWLLQNKKFRTNDNYINFKMFVAILLNKF